MRQGQIVDLDKHVETPKLWFWRLIAWSFCLLQIGDFIYIS